MVRLRVLCEHLFIHLHTQLINMIKIIILVKDISLNEDGTFNLFVKIVVNDGCTQLEHTFENIPFISSQDELETTLSNLSKIKLDADLGFNLSNQDIFILY